MSQIDEVIEKPKAEAAEELHEGVENMADNTKIEKGVDEAVTVVSETEIKKEVNAEIGEKNETDHQTEKKEPTEDKTEIIDTAEHKGEEIPHRKASNKSGLDDDSDDDDSDETKSMISISTRISQVSGTQPAPDIYSSSTEEDSYDEADYAITVGPKDFIQLPDVNFEHPFFNIEIDDPNVPNVKSEEIIATTTSIEAISEVSFSEAYDTVLAISKDQLFDKDSLIELLYSLQKRKQDHFRANTLYNRGVMEHFRRKNLKRMLLDDSEDRKTLERRYRKVLDELRIMMLEQKQYRQESDDKIFVLRKRLFKYESEKQMNATALVKSMKDICLHLQSIASGQIMQEKTMLTLISKQEQMRNTMSNVRLIYIKAKNKMETVNKLTKQLEDLGEGLRIADFEKISAEVQSLSDKIEERNNELAKLRVRCFSDTQKLAHVREKENMLGNKIEERQEDLQFCADRLFDTREYCSKLKKKQLAMRKEFEKMRDKCGLLDKPILLRDYDRTLEDIKKTEIEVAKYRGIRDDLLKKSNAIHDILYGEKPPDTESQKFDTMLNCQLNAIHAARVPRLYKNTVPVPDRFKSKTAREILSTKPK